MVRGDSPFLDIRRNRSELYAWLTLLIALVLIIAVRIRFLDFPLERDEGEFAYIAKLILNNLEPYKYAYTMKLPGTALVYALFMSIFGQTVQGIHIGFLISNLAAILVVYALVKRLFNPTVGAISAMSYGFLTLHYSFYGFAFHATHLVVLFCTLGIYYLLIALENKTYKFFLTAGVFLGIGFLMKQHGMYFFCFAIAYFLYHTLFHTKQNAKYVLLRLCTLIAAFLLPLILVTAWVDANGDFNNFFRWTFLYAYTYVSNETISSSIPRLKIIIPNVLKGFYLLWLTALFGFILQFFTKLAMWKKVFINLLMFFSLFAVSAGLYFAPHYFIILLPAVVIFIAIAIEALSTFLTKKLKLPNTALIIFLLIAAAGFWTDRNYFFKLPLSIISHKIYNKNPFNETPLIADVIKANTSKSDKIAVLGSEPEILFLADRVSSTGYIYTYGLMEIHPGNISMQKELIKELMTNPPKLIVFCHLYKSWAPRNNSPMYIFEWLQRNLNRRYEKIAVFNYLENGKYLYVLGEDAKIYNPTSDEYILILKEKDGIDKNFVWFM
ncbi:MAG: glycosyltransferase family 39 protein [Nitrospirae bacterium]|nr:glycosyltransferase family 39 protein [Nitrospirota bacterium]MBF0534823.1 glycosyltransferase family 39 protein [Nitrospirota bacterium]MBF0616497.1 glycosyltransferase family 39 protein [Nitrospirota bacterium]